MVVVAAAQQAYAQLQTAFKSNDLSQCQKLVLQLKLYITQLPSLSPHADTAKINKDEIRLAVSTLEIGAFVAIKSRDLAGFERCFLQLKTLYQDYCLRIASNPLSKVSDHSAPLTGLYLLYLLAAGRQGEFHMELELLESEDKTNPCIHYAVEVDRWLTEGNYAQVLSVATVTSKPEGSAAVGGLPIPEQIKPYAPLCLEQLAAAVRRAVAESLERSYSTLSVPTAVRLLQLTSRGQLDQFAQAENKRKEEEQLSLLSGSYMMVDDSTPAQRRLKLQLSVRWVLKGDVLTFEKHGDEGEGLAAVDLLRNAIGYATDLERII